MVLRVLDPLKATTSRCIWLCNPRSTYEASLLHAWCDTLMAKHQLKTRTGALLSISIHSLVLVPTESLSASSPSPWANIGTNPADVSIWQKHVGGRKVKRPLVATKGFTLGIRLGAIAPHDPNRITGSLVSFFPCTSRELWLRDNPRWHYNHFAGSSCSGNQRNRAFVHTKA